MNHMRLCIATLYMFETLKWLKQYTVVLLLLYRHMLQVLQVLVTRFDFAGVYQAVCLCHTKQLPQLQVIQRSKRFTEIVCLALSVAF